MKEKRQFDKNATNLCKGIAICIMLYFHAFGATDESTFQKVLPVVFNVFGPYGNVCVSFFVLLTGYGFTKSYLSTKRNYGQSVAPRVLKLYQSYWAVFIVMFLLAPILSSGRNDWWTAYGPLSLSFFRHVVINFLGLSHYVFGDNWYTLNQTWWYMSLALVLLLVLPFLCMLWKKLGWGAMAVLLVLAVLLKEMRYFGYFPTAMAGVCLAGSEGFSEVERRGRQPLGYLIQLLLLFAAGFFWYRMRQHGFYPLIADGMMAVVGCQFAFAFLYRIPGVSRLLCLIGRHSGNIYYMHSFVYSFWILTNRLVFRARYDLLIWVAILGISLLLSMALNALRRYSGYDRLFKRWDGRLSELLQIEAATQEAAQENRTSKS